MVTPLSGRRHITIAATLIVAVVTAAAYMGGYAYVRSQGWLVHRSGFAHGNTDNHSVAVGDHNHQAGAVAEIFFAPLRQVETMYWYVRHPVGKPWPYTAPP